MRKTYLLTTTASGTKKIPVVFSEFPDTETHCVINEDAARELKGKSVLVVHDLYPAQNSRIIQLLILIDLLQELNVASISLCTPYFPYARQDKRHMAGEAASLHAICRLLVNSGVAAVYTIDCHFMKGAAEIDMAGLHFYNYSLGERLIAHCATQLGDGTFDSIGPDNGSNYLVKQHGNQNMYKKRGSYDLASGSSNRDVVTLDHDHMTFTHSTVVIVDDMISTGGTILRAVRNLQSRGISQICCVAVHGLFLKDSLKTLQHEVALLCTSDTIASDVSIPLVAKLYADEIVPSWLIHTR